MNSILGRPSGSRQQSGKISAGSAFTLIELLVVVCVIGLLAATLAPTLAGSRIGSQSLQCMNNNRQLSAAWRMYADDSNERLVYASTADSSSLISTDPSDPDNYAWTGAHMDFNGANRANWDPAYDMMKRPLWPYSPNAGIYKCPSDHSAVVFLGISRPRISSFSMNLYMGGFAPGLGGGPEGNDGGWPFADPYRIFSKTTDLTTPGPAKTFLFTDMRPEAINWGSFMTDMDGYPNNPAQYQLVDFPGVFHSVGACISFGDGHVEIHRWLDPRTAPPSAVLSPATPSMLSAGNQDIAWFQAHATSPK